MRITSLHLQNYKCFDDLLLDNLGQRIVLVGPNGCGKSAVLEAIAVLKEFAGTYNPKVNVYHRLLQSLNKHGLAWPDNVSLPIRGTEAAATITAEVAFDDAEKGLIGGLVNAKVSVLIQRNSEVVVSVEGNVTRLFSHYDPES